MIFILLIIFIFIFVYLNLYTNEHFGVFGFPSRINRPTRNMSYDIRGEAYFPPLINIPFNNSSIEPNIKPVLIN